MEKNMILEIIEKYENELLSLYNSGLSQRAIPNYVKGSIKVCEAQTLYSIIRENNYKDIIDVGTGPGFSAMYFAQALKDQGLDHKVITIDPDPNIEQTSTALREFGLQILKLEHLMMFFQLLNPIVMILF